VIFTFDFLSSQLKAKYASRKLWFVLKVCVLFLVALYFTRAAYVLIKGDSPEKRSYSPITINYMRNIPFTSNHKIVIAGNAECNQIGLYLDGYDVYTIPAEDPENGGLNAAYGIYPWTKEQALDYFRKHNISYLVFCFGNGKENFINDSVSKYGPYIHRLIEQKEPIVKHKIELTDGIILELSPDLR
jgi:hypothetical protein